MTNNPYGDQYLLALDRAATWHADQTKKGTGRPYISHLLTVSAVVWEDGGSETEAIAALLHDTVEDGRATLAEVHKLFGAEVAGIVDHCSDSAPQPGEEKAPWLRRKTQHVAGLRGLGSSAGSGPTMRVVGADKLTNVRSILIDHRAGAEGLWGRFKGGLGGSVWYYTEMADIVSGALPGSMVAHELGLAVHTLTDVMTELAGTLGELPATLTPLLGEIAVDRGCDVTSHLAFELARTVVTDRPGEPRAAMADVLAWWLGPDATPETVLDDLTQATLRS